MSAPKDPQSVEADLTEGARGHYPTEAAAVLLTRAFGGRFARPGWPWIARATGGGYYIDATRLGDDDIGMLSGGEQRVLAITRSLLGEIPVYLSDALPGLDPSTSSLAIDALTHATGTGESRTAAIGPTASYRHLSPNTASRRPRGYESEGITQ